VVYLIPVVAGIVLQRLSRPVAIVVARIAAPISKTPGLLLVLLTAVIGAKSVISLGARSLLVVLLFVAGAIFAGYLLGAPPSHFGATSCGCSRYAISGTGIRISQVERNTWSDCSGHFGLAHLRKRAARFVQEVAAERYSSR
jgi:hypothetical protein